MKKKKSKLVGPGVKASQVFHAMSKNAEKELKKVKDYQPIATVSV